MNNEADIHLRTITEQDCALLFTWVNDPAVRSSSFSQDPIPWEDHIRWFRNKLNDPHCCILIGFNNENVPIGQVRFDSAEDGSTEVDVHISTGFRGRGFGALLMKESVRRFFEIAKVDTVHAFVKTDNASSIQTFKKAGFKNEGRENKKGHDIFHFMIHRI